METWPLVESVDEAEHEAAPLYGTNPFQIDDIMIFDDSTLRRWLTGEDTPLERRKLAWSLRDGPGVLRERIAALLPQEERPGWQALLQQEVSPAQMRQARNALLAGLFWDLTYWKTPELYNELTEGETLHPGIFEELAPDVRDHIVLDSAAGSGRATLECLRYGARRVYAVDPAPGMLRTLADRLRGIGEMARVSLRRGSFAQMPLAANSVELTLACSAFLSRETQGGESGLAELWRVTRSGGKIVIIWPQPQDYRWFARHGFQYRSFPPLPEPVVRFRSMRSAIRCVTRFYARRPACLSYLLEHRQPAIPYVLLGFKQPADYCWLAVEKD